jgi:dihydropteroate synthase
MKNRLFPQIGSRFYVMGILNLTTDSFSGDGLLQQTDPLEASLALAKQFAVDGADILDLGAESTRPGATPVSADEECARLLPVLTRLKAEFPDMLFSVDTYKATVAEAALEAGAQMINDIWGFSADDQMGAVVARFGATAVLMHNRRTVVQTEINATLGGRDVGAHSDNITREVIEGLRQSVAIAHAAGLQDDQIILDPGIGFGKGTEQNLCLLKELDQLKELGYPLLLGVSRKSFIGYKLNLPPEERLEGSLAANVYGMLHGADIVRVHDVRQTVRAARMLEAILQA